jgi:two-component system LytT family sensor kinase
MEESRLRFWENWIVLAGITLMVTKYITGVTNQFNSDIDYLVLQGIPTFHINLAIDNYNHFLNTILPISLFGICVYFAWYIFQYFVFPKFNNVDRDQSPLVAMGMVVGLLLVGFAIYQSLRLHWRLTETDLNPYHFFRRTRKITLFANFFTYLAFILAYAYLSNLFYTLCRRFRQEGAMYKLLINFCFSLCSLLFIILLYGPQYFAVEFREITPALCYLVIAVAIVYGEMLFFFFLRRERPWVGIMGVLLVGLVSLVIIDTLDVAFTKSYISLWNQLSNELNLKLLVMVGICGSAIVAGGVHNIYYKQSKQLLTKVNVQSAELKQLRAQVNPHFLFNALNSLYSTALKENADKTASGIQKLGDMMRFMLNQSDYITIQQEMEQLDLYIELQKMRLDENISVDARMENITAPLMIAPMLLNPFVENAFKHGVSLQADSWIRITLTHDKNTLYFKVHNSLHKNREEMDTERNNHGIGLENVKRRLTLLYPDKHSLFIQQSEQDFFVSLTLNV